MISLSTLQDSTRTRIKKQRVGRGVGSKRGKTCCRGHKGDKSRSGYKRRRGKEGGRVPLFKQLPVLRGFNNEQFTTRFTIINLDLIEQFYQDGDLVNLVTLRQKHLISGNFHPRLKLLGNGALTKKVEIELDAISSSAKQFLEENKIVYRLSSLC